MSQTGWLETLYSQAFLLMLWEILIYQIDDSKKENGSRHSYYPLVAAYLLGTLVVAVTKTAPDMLARYIFLVLLCEVTVFLSAFLCFRIIETRLIAEFPHFLLAEKTEIKSHMSL